MLATGDLAPDFSLTAANGERYSLDDRLTLAIFFKTTCPTCQYAWPFYERLYKAYGPSGLEVRGISQHDREKTRTYADNFNATFPHLIDEGWKVSRRYDPEFVPTGFLIGSNKRIIATIVSWNRDELNRLSRDIASQLNVKPREIFKAGEDVIVFKPG